MTVVTIQPPTVTVPNVTATPPPITVQPPLISVTPPPIKPPVIEYSIEIPDAIATLQAAGYTVTAPAGSGTGTGSTGTGTGTGSTGTGTSTTPGAWDGYIIEDGVLNPYWGGTPAPANQLAGAPGGNWDSASSQSVQSGSIVWQPNGSYMEWLPHPQGVAGNPSQNGIGIDLEGYSKFVMVLTPKAQINQMSMFMCGVAGFGSYVGANPPVTVTDQALQGPITIATNLAANTPATITVPLASLGWPNKTAPAAPYTPAATWIYKIAVQINDPASGVTADISEAYFAK